MFNPLGMIMDEDLFENSLNTNDESIEVQNPSLSVINGWSEEQNFKFRLYEQSSKNYSHFVPIIV